MKKMVIHGAIIGIIFMFTSSVMVYAGDTAALSLQDALKAATANNLDYKNVSLNLKSAELSLAETQANSLTKPSPTGILQANSNLKTAQKNYELAQIDLTVNVADAYFSLVKAEKTVAVYENALKTAKDNLAIVNDKLAAGVATNLDKINAEANVSSKESDLSKASLNLKLAKIKLSQTLRTGAGQEFTLSTSPSYDEYKADLDKDLTNALETRLEIQQALANIEVRETEVKLNTNSYTPTVTLEKSKVSLEQAKIALEQAKDKIVTEVNQNYLSLTDAFNRIKSSEQSLAASKENLRVVQLKYQANIAVNSEVIDAQNSLTQAQVNLESAIMDYQIARIKYAKSVGTDSAI